MVLSTSRANVFLISVNDCPDGSPVGVWFDTRLGTTADFRSTAQLLLQINDALSQEPHGQTNLRTLLPAVGQSPDKPLQYGRLATFSLRILFRQNASWQGEIVWLERRQSCCFRSVLELIQLLDRALRDESFALQKDFSPINEAK